VEQGTVLNGRGYGFEKEPLTLLRESFFMRAIMTLNHSGSIKQ
jgi:hypothetical protein